MSALQENDHSSRLSIYTCMTTRCVVLCAPCVQWSSIRSINWMCVKTKTRWDESKTILCLVDDPKVRVLHKLLEAAMLISPWSKRRNNILTIWQDIWAKYTPCPYKLALPLHFVHSHCGLRCPDLAHWELVSMYYGHFPWKKESMKQVLYFNILQCCQ